MLWKQTAVSAALAVGLAAAPLSHAEAHRHFPLFWPFFAGAAVVGTAAAVATAPFRAIAGAPYYGYGPGYGYYAPPPPAYYAPNYYYGRPYYYPY